MRTVILAVVVLVCGCEKAQDAVDELKPATLARFAAYQSAVEKGMANPVTTPPSIPEKLIFPGGKVTANAEIIHAEWVQIPVVHVDNEIVMEAGSNFIEVRNLCHGSYASDGGKPDVYRRWFRDFDGIKYLVVVTGTAFAQTVSDTTFSGGFSGGLTVIDVEKQVSLGSIPVTSGMSDEVEVVVNTEHSVDRQLRWNAKTNAGKAIISSLAPYVSPESGQPKL